MAERDWRAAGERIEALIGASGSGGAVARERAEELVRLVADLYGAGLERLLGLLHDRGALTGDVLAAVAGDELVAALLLVHGLHPYDARTRIEQALDAARPRLGDVRLLDVGADGVVRLRLPGGCQGSAVALGLAVREAIEAAAPEVTAIEIEEPPAAGRVIPVDALFARLTKPAGPDPVAPGAVSLDAAGPGAAVPGSA